jgi:hypothetical protein
MRIFLHIGLEKTGTSSIQRFFRLNREALKKRSILYSLVAGNENHMALAAAAQDERKADDLRLIYELDSPEKIRKFRVRLSEDLAAEAARSRCSTLVFSGEHCSSRLTSPQEVETLIRFLSAVSDDITVIVYLRRQDEFLCSTYSTDVKSGHTGPMRVPGPELRKNRYDYDLLLERWCSVVGREKLICKIYEAGRFPNSDVVPDFAKTVGISSIDNYQRPKRINESLDVGTLEFLRLFNTAVPRFKNKKLNPSRGKIVQLLQRFSKGPRPTLPLMEVTEFMAGFRDSNARVAEKYFGGAQPDGDPLFGKIGQHDNRAEMQPLSTEAAVAIAAHLWEDQQEKVLEQPRRIQGLPSRQKAKGSVRQPGGE